MQKAVLSHAKSLRWLLARLENLGSKPHITSIRVLRHETVFVTSRGVIHNPKDWHTLRGYEAKTEGKEVQNEPLVPLVITNVIGGQLPEPPTPIAGEGTTG